MNMLLIIGLLLNSTVITANRFWRPIPDKIYIPCLIVGIVCIIIGLILTKQA